MPWANIHIEKEAASITHSKGKVLHHTTHATTELVQGIVASVGALAGHEVLDAAVGVNLHGAEVVKAVNEAGLLAKLLVKGVRQVVRGVGRDEQHRAAHLGQLDGEGARRCRLAHTTLAADKDPSQRLLVQDRLERRLQTVGVEHSCRHCVFDLCFVFCWVVREVEEGRRKMAVT